MFLSDCSEWLKFRLNPFPTATIFQLHVKQWQVPQTMFMWIDSLSWHQGLVSCYFMNMFNPNQILFNPTRDLPPTDSGASRSLFAVLLSTVATDTTWDSAFGREIQRLVEIESQLTELEELMEDHQLMTAVHSMALIRHQLLTVCPHLKLQLTMHMIQVIKRLCDHFRQWHRIPLVDFQFIWIHHGHGRFVDFHSSWQARSSGLWSFVSSIVAALPTLGQCATEVEQPNANSKKSERSLKWSCLIRLERKWGLHCNTWTEIT